MQIQINGEFKTAYVPGAVMIIGNKTLTVVGKDDGDMLLMEVTAKGAVREYRMTSRGRLVRIN